MVPTEMVAKRGGPVADRAHETALAPAPALELDVDALARIAERVNDAAATAVGALRRIMEDQAARGWPRHRELLERSAGLLREAEDASNALFRLHCAVSLKTTLAYE